MRDFLTVAIRGAWSDSTLGDAEKVERIKWINEILHRAATKVWVLRLRTHVWTEEDFGSLMWGYVDDCPGIKGEVLAAQPTLARNAVALRRKRSVSSSIALAISRPSGPALTVQPSGRIGRPPSRFWRREGAGLER
jgi:hypothetical protein